MAKWCLVKPNLGDADGIHVTVAPIFLFLSDPRVQRLFAALGAPGVDVRCVGGCVRDAMAARAVNDIDIGTPDLPEVVIKRLEAAGIKAIPTGLEHGTVTAVLDGATFEITTLRRDTSCDGRHAVVEFTHDWHEDASRRDFTFNAMSLRPDGQVFDFFGGADDLYAGRVRFVGVPADRIKEDYLRILRLFRFHAYFGQATIDAPTLNACAELKAGLANLSPERVTQEMRKLLCAPQPLASLTAMQTCGVLTVVLPEGTQLPVLSNLIALEEKLPLPLDWRRRLGALLVMADARGLAKRMRLSNHDADFLQALVADQPALSTTMALSALDLNLYRLGREIILNRCLLAAARAPSPDWRPVITRAAAWTARPMPLNGDDLIARGARPGPALGEALRAAEVLWVTGSFAAARDELVSCAEAAISKH